MNIGDTKTTYCTECNKHTLHTLVSEHEEYQVGDEIITGNVIYWKCSVCEDGEIVDDFDIECKYNRAIKKQKGYLSGAEIKAIREKKNMNIESFVQLLNNYGFNFDEESYEDIENDYEMQPEQLEKILRIL